MTPIDFPQSNAKFSAPEGYTEEQVATIPAFIGQLYGGCVDGDKVVMVAWKPDEDEIADIVAGKPIFLCMMGGLLPHTLTTKPQFQ